MNIVVYGPGCPNCRRLAENTRAAADNLGWEPEITKVEDVMAIASSGVMRTPAMKVDGILVLHGRVPEPAEIERILVSVGA
jgi:small redox-active disulfide protein 2